MQQSISDLIIFISINTDAKLQFMLFILFGGYLQNILSSSTITESFYIIPGSKQTFYTPARFIQNHQKLMYERITYFAKMLEEEINRKKRNTKRQQIPITCTFRYQNMSFLSLYDFFKHIADDKLTGDFYESFSKEIEFFITKYFESSEEFIQKDKPTSQYTMEELRNVLLKFHNDDLNKLYKIIMQQSQLDEIKLSKMCENLVVLQLQKYDNPLKTINYAFDAIKTENIKKSFMEFMLPMKQSENGLRLDSDVINSIESILNSETKVVNLFVDFHAEQFIYEYMSQSFDNKKQPNLEECNNFLFEIYEDMKKIIEISNKNILTGLLHGSIINICFIRNNLELALKHLNFAMSYFLNVNDEILKEVYKKLNSIEEILPSYITFILKNFRNEKIFFEVNVYIVEYQKFDENIYSKKCLRYEDEDACRSINKYYSIYFNFTSNPIPNFDRMSWVTRQLKTESIDSDDGAICGEKMDTN